MASATSPARQRKRKTDEAAPPIPTPWMDTEQTAGYMGVSERTLEDWRRLGIGPDFASISPQLIKYHVTIVDDWMKSKMRATRAEKAA